MSVAIEALDDRLREVVRDALNGLADGCGRNTARVAAKLEAAGCQGRPGMCATCPVAVWVLRAVIKVFPDAVVNVSEHAAVVVLVAGMATVSLPKVVAEFAADFDAGDFVHLRSVIESEERS